MSFQKITLASLFLALTVAVSSASACTNASLIGVFGFIDVGTDSAGDKVTGVGQITFDGNGNFNGTATDSVNGTISGNALTGIYSVAKNCTGTVLLNPNTTPQHFNFVLDAGGKGLQFIETESGFVRTGFALARGTVTCGLTGTRRSFALNVTGAAIGVGPIGAVSRLTLNGTGTLSGSTTFNLNGTVYTGSLTGTYTENSNCTGTAQISLSGLPTSNYNFVVVKSGTEILLIETDANTIVSGMMQQ